MIEQITTESTNGKIGAVMVLGAGVAGIQASLDLAEMGFKVYLVEDQPSIGGAMAQLDKTFPTNDCAMCLLSPKLVDTARHHNIEIITNAQLHKVDGQAGNFSVTVKKRPRFIDEDKCTGCGTCTTNCPVRNIAHFEEVDEIGQVQLDEEDSQTLQEILTRHEAERAAVISVLQDVNAHYRYLPEDVLRHVAHALKLPLSQVYGIATFYNSFSLVPRGRYVVRVCMGTACHVKGGHRILQALERTLAIPAGGTTEDKNFSLEEVRCLGCCGLAPVITINEDLYGSVTQAKLPKILDRYQGEPVAAETTTAGADDG
ncbi:MAG TPA: NADH-quinone oxidoreductase subunit NuoE [Phycisphaerae bacterium]|nr:NADH-quinone oxidoreductase subunit NuoE [Phycisphaerae bacterium]HDZ43887.1 NADH-quinone oxidoreductase subunit NuoE [Phycisphaerae bacterium]